MDKKEQGLTIGDIFLAIKRNLIGAVITGAFVFVLGVIFTFGVVKEKYRSSGKLIISVSTDSGNVDYNSSLRLVQTVSELIKTNIVIDPVVERLENAGYHFSSGEVQKMLSTNYSNTSFMINVNATYIDPEVTQKVAQYSMESLVEQCNTDETLKNAFEGAVAIPEKANKGVYHSPNKTLYLVISFLSAGVIALLYVFMKEIFSNRFRDKKNLENVLGMNALAVFEDKKEYVKGGNTKQLIDLNARTMSPYNRLITNIRYSSIDNELKSIMFTSSKKGELKSFISSNLALVMAESKKKVCIIDLDLHCPNQHNIFKLDKEKGISEYIIGKNTKEEIIKKTKYGVDVITAGERVCNTNLVIGSNKLKNFIKELKEIYDYVIVDTSPTVTSEAIGLAKVVDGVIYNISIRDTNKNLVISSIRDFNNIKANIIGVCLTKYKDKQVMYYYDK